VPRRIAKGCAFHVCDPLRRPGYPMTPTLEDILELVESVAPAHLSEPWDNPGLQVGDRSKRVQKILLALDPTLRAIQAAVRLQAQLLFTHHPLIFKPVSQLDPADYPGNVVFLAIRSDVAVVCAHTNLDSAAGGINDCLASILGLTDVTVLQEAPGNPGAGLGRLGSLERPITLGGMAETIKERLQTPSLRVIGPMEKRIERIAVVGGSGSDLAELAFRKGADLLVTGDVSHHKALDAAALGLAMIDAGHYATERAALHAFKDSLEAVFERRRWNTVIIWDSEEENPSRPV